jgi:hypothetical protein
VNAAAASPESRVPRWDTRPRHVANDAREVDFGQWHKDALPRDAYCMDVDKIEYRIGADGTVRVVGIYELIRWGWQHDLDDIPERLSPYEGKVALLRRISEAIAEGQGAAFPTFFVWHRPDLSEFVVCGLEEWATGHGKALGFGPEALAGVMRRLPAWDVDPLNSRHPPV